MINLYFFIILFPNRALWPSVRTLTLYHTVRRVLQPGLSPPEREGCLSRGPSPGSVPSVDFVSGELAGRLPQLSVGPAWTPEADGVGPAGPLVASLADASVEGQPAAH